MYARYLVEPNQELPRMIVKFGIIRVGHSFRLNSGVHIDPLKLDYRNALLARPARTVTAKTTCVPSSPMRLRQWLNED